MTMGAATDEKYMISFGVGQRHDDGPALVITENDAKRAAKEFQGRCHIPDKNIFPITGENCTKENFTNALKKVAALTKDQPADLVIVYFSGHGCYFDGQYFLVCRDTTPDNLDSALSGSEFITLLNGITTKKMLVLLDCCHAAGFGKGKTVAVPFNQEDFLQFPNRVIITASDSQQLSFVSKPVSVFTFALIEGLAGHYLQQGEKDITVFDLAMYIRERVYPLSEHTQQPQFNVLQNGLTSNFLITRYPNGAPPRAFANEQFTLVDGANKEIETANKIEKDLTYRQNFTWLTNVQVTGNENVVVTGNNTTINVHQSSTVDDIRKAIELITEFFPLSDTLTRLRNEKSPGLNAIAKKLEEVDFMDTVLIKKQNLIFVGRKEFKEPMYKMLNGELLDVIFLNGKPQTGLSYIQNFVSHVAEQYESFDYHYINIQKIQKYNRDELVSAAHVSESIATKIGMEFNIKEYKLIPFIGKVKYKLSELAKSNKKCLLFIDQFDAQISPIGLKDLIEALTDLITEENTKFYLIVAGYSDFDGWQPEKKIISNPVALESTFQPAEINNFLEKLYQHPKIKNNSNINKETFIASANAVIPSSAYGQEPNVANIGSLLRAWYAEIRKKIPV